MTAGTATLDDIHRALLLSQRAALLAMLPVVVQRPSLKAGTLQLIAAVEEELGMERTFPPKHPRNGAPPLCNCGCGQAVAWYPERRRWAMYVVGHEPKALARS